MHRQYSITLALSRRCSDRPEELVPSSHLLALKSLVNVEMSVCALHIFHGLKKKKNDKKKKHPQTKHGHSLQVKFYFKSDVLVRLAGTAKGS